MKKIQEYVTSDVLKLMALVAMSLEHAGTILYGSAHPFILLGRIAYPIFAYLIMYHVYKTGCFIKYIKRLFFFGVLSTALLMPFGLTDYHIFFSFLLPILYLYFSRTIAEKSWGITQKNIAQKLVFIACLFASIPLNYSFLGFLYMVALYHCFKHRTTVWICVCLVLGCLLNPLNVDYAIVSGIITAFLLAVPPQDTRQSYRLHKWFYYLYYPLHLAVLKGISLF